uniref:PXT107.4 n=1 Tax=Nocardia sp. 107 TaxID=373212 RepID=Q27I91_9NOCA|nr:pXT107.4 [Nocardia sp. 107]
MSLVAAFRDQFGASQHEVIHVNVASNGNPGDGIGAYTPVQLVNFVVGVVPPEVRKNARGEEKLTGGTTWYRADEIRATNSTGKPARTAATRADTYPVGKHPRRGDVRQHPKTRPGRQLQPRRPGRPLSH